MKIEVALLIAIIGCFIGLAGWLTSRDKRLSDDSEWRGQVNAKLDLIIGIQKDHEELRNKVQEQEKHIVALEHDLDSIKSYISGGKYNEN